MILKTKCDFEMAIPHYIGSEGVAKLRSSIRDIDNYTDTYIRHIRTVDFVPEKTAESIQCLPG